VSPHCDSVQPASHRARWQLAGALALLATFVAAPALAEPAAERTFAYDAPAECPSRVEFSALVGARTKAWPASTSPFAVAVTIQKEPDALVGRVTFERAGQSTPRELRAASCAELAEALSLIVAILVDPQAQDPPPPPSSKPLPPPPSSVPVPAAAPPPRPLWFSAGLEAVFATAVTGAVEVGGRLFVGLGRGEDSLLASSVRLSFAHAASHEVSPASGLRADFSLDTGRLDACIARVAHGGLSLEPCPFFELGRVQAVGLHPDGDVTSNDTWAALGLVLRPSFTLWHRLVLGGALGVSLPVTRYRYAFTGESELTHTASVGLDAALGLGVRFP
jgi:hypothetical protein